VYVTFIITLYIITFDPVVAKEETMAAIKARLQTGV